MGLCKSVESFFSEFLSIVEITDYLDYNFDNNLKLDELTQPYALLNKELFDFKFFLRNGIVFRQIASLEKEINQIKKLNISLIKQQELYSEQFKLTKKNYDRNIKLNDKGVISDVDKEQIETIYLTEKRQLENFSTNQINNEIKIAQLQPRINELTASRREELTTWKNRMIERINVVQNEIESWEKRFLIKSPIDGIISMNNKVSVGYFVRLDEIIVDVIPKDQNLLLAIVRMPTINSGDIKVGVKSQIRLDAYPYKEYGAIESYVSSISIVPQDNQQNPYYEVQINLQDTLKTTYHKIIPFTPNMTGNCIIIKEERSLLSRFFDELSNLFLN